ncbi:MAG: fused MFS/spermidine synthase, partial [Gammaproteobacteria bacterium]|nr:fused MFS/spermidine synthase [Gammaproteobacteria bacterium]
MNISNNYNLNRTRLAWYGLTVFLSSAILLVLEITAGRLIAPYVGVTIYSWTSIIGVILAGLSLGNWLGGRWADRGADER